MHTDLKQTPAIPSSCCIHYTSCPVACRCGSLRAASRPRARRQAPFASSIRAARLRSSRTRRADDSWEDWEEAADVPQLPKLSGTPAPAAAAVDNKFAGEDEGENEPAYEVPKTQEVML